MRIGFIGLGNMGSAMAANLIKAGHDVTAYNRSRAKVDALAAGGARPAGSIAEACEGDMVISMLADDDAEAYAGYSAALKMPRETDDEIAARTAAMQAAARRASEAPLACVEACLELVQVAEALAGRSNPNASSDVAVAALLGEAAARGAAANVMINLPSTGDAELEGRLTRQVSELLGAIDDLTSQTHQVIGSGDRREPLDPTGPA